MTRPLMMIAAPVASPYRHGLYSAAAVVDAVDPREFLAGVSWEPGCARAPAPTTLAAACAPDRAAMVLADGVEQAVAGPPIRLYTGVRCRLPGRDDLPERARARLALIEQQSLEFYAWTGAAGNSPFLADAGTVVLGGSESAALTPVAGIGLLEAFLSESSGGLGVLWAPRWTAPTLVAAQLVRPDGPRLVAPLGDPVVFAQTSGAGPAGVVPAEPEVVWLYATGAVQVRRGPVIAPSLVESYSRTDGDVFAVVERPYLVGWGCPAGAVRVRLPAQVAPLSQAD